MEVRMIGKPGVGIVGKSGVALTLFALTSLAIAGDTTRLYRCEVQGTITYSDTACATESAKVEVESAGLNTYGANEATHRTRTKAEMKTPRKQRSGSIAEEQMKHKQRCKEIADRLNAVTDKLWRDDSARKHTDQRLHLEGQQRKLEEEHRSQKCR